jgi:hypothetical protein
MCVGGCDQFARCRRTLLFLSHSNKAAVHLKWIMIFFEKFSGMRINYSKSDLTPINISEEETQEYAKKIAARLKNSLLPTWVFLCVMKNLGKKIYNQWWIKL